MRLTIKLVTLSLLLALGLAAQTATYTVPSGTACNGSVNACYLPNLTTTDPAIAPLGYFIGGYGGGYCCAQFDFQLVQGQNAAAGATYCIGNGGPYTQTPRSDLGPNYTEWKLDCVSNEWTNGSGPGELGNVGPYHIVVDLITTKSVVTGRWCNNHGCVTRTITTWTIMEGTVAMTPVSNP